MHANEKPTTEAERTDVAIILLHAVNNNNNSNINNNTNTMTNIRRSTRERKSATSFYDEAKEELKRTSPPS